VSLNSSPSIVQTSANSLVRFLDTNGDGTGTKNAIGNYSLVAQPFFIQPASNEIFLIYSFLMQLSDSGALFSIDEYGNLNTALTNGLLVRLKRAGVVTLDLLDGQPIKINDHYAHLAQQVQLIDWAGTANTLRAEFTVGAGPYVLYGSEQDRLEVLCNDNFTGLIDQTFLARGIVAG
jgi:hypothetical protein